MLQTLFRHNVTPPVALRFVSLVLLILLSLSAFRAYRVRATAEEAMQFTPARTRPIVIPAGTHIHAMLWNGILATAVGDVVTARVSSPVVLSGMQLEGEVERMSRLGTKGRVYVNFHVLTDGARTFMIQARPVVTIAPLEGDMDILTSALKTLMGASLGGAFGASADNPDLIYRSMLQGAVPSTSEGTTVSINAVLTHDLEVVGTN